ncbi:MAG: nitroreductase family protein [Bacteroidales bacterium]|nr:nitroreductase family protein [Bacteroidales bacterium]
MNSEELLEYMKTRRSTRKFSTSPVNRTIIENCIRIAGTAPSGANMQPWTFVLVEDSQVKERIRTAAEKVEGRFYTKKVSDDWREKLVPLHTGIEKSFLTGAPYLICVFLQRYGFSGKSKKVKHYYPSESVGIATGFLLAALHLSGISSFTYTPAPMAFLSEILERPQNERPYMTIAAGYPADDYVPPNIKRKKPEEIIVLR